MPIELKPTHRCRFLVDGGWRGGEIVFENAWGVVIVNDTLTRKTWLLSASDVVNRQPIDAKRNEEGAV